MRGLGVIVVLVAATAYADAPAAKELRGVAMVGPYPSQVEACKTAPPCGETRAAQPDCRALTTKRDPNLDEEAAGKRTWIKNDRAVLAPVTCTVPKGVDDRHAQYYLFVKRDDGWWRSAGVELELWGNDNGETQHLDGLVKDVGERVVMHVQAVDESLDCSKQGTTTQTVDLLLLADVAAAGGAPVTYPPLATGQHLRREIDEGSEGATTCTPLKKSYVLAESWPDASTLVLKGAARWFEAFGDARNTFSFREDKKAASTAGTYKLVR